MKRQPIPGDKILWKGEIQIVKQLDHEGFWVQREYGTKDPDAFGKYHYFKSYKSNAWDHWEFVDDVVPSDVVTNEAGGSQAKIASALSLVPAHTMLEVGQVLKQGAEKYGVDNWRKISKQDHLDHALAHIYAHISGKETGEKDLINAICRLFFASEVA